MASTRVSPALHIALPGLCWPENALRDLVFDLPMPALSTLLGRARAQHYPVSDTTGWLGQLAGLPATRVPVAELRLLGLGQAGTGEWLCLDPVHLRVEKTQLIVGDPAELHLEDAEADALAASLRPVLEELGSLHVGTAANWLLKCNEDAHLRTTPLPEAIGLNADIFMPQADNVRIWRRVLNEVQMTLHAHPVNADRSARGLPAVNSLWPWGEGTLPPAPATPSAPWTLLCANGLLWQGVAKHMGCAYHAGPACYTKDDERTLLISHALATAERTGDALRWRDSLQALEKNWFAPMLAAWQAGELPEIGIHGSGAGQGMSFVLRRSDRWRFWRKAAPLTVLGAKETEGRHASPPSHRA